jgi:hypothetical protein
VRSKSSGAFILSEKAEGRGKNGGWWMLDFEFWIGDEGEEKPNGEFWILDFEWWIEDDVECWILNGGLKTMVNFGF